MLPAKIATLTKMSLICLDVHRIRSWAGRQTNRSFLMSWKPNPFKRDRPCPRVTSTTGNRRPPVGLSPPPISTSLPSVPSSFSPCLHPYVQEAKVNVDLILEKRRKLSSHTNTNASSLYTSSVSFQPTLELQDQFLQPLSTEASSKVTNSNALGD